ncbi:zinc-binding alcohol dehydrogenase family protein [Paenibacillus glycinis]|uniref:Zinc-type alcohol dehydrogenase-like protein n=1 Tax=Paenibacillus glycinis TaxID=2697035 RepID=A0ABW9XRC8_9BACL|nr:zinc-binding alcohol dehydrogenase family protein [Paenibacillus glycinis]NBD25180.1 zinc-binding alcohol dehydrogenase family protein [Paenibacillus glycinis]
MTQMKGIGIYRYLPIDDPESLQDVVVEKPVPQGRDLLVNVKAVSVNPVDAKVRAPKDRTEASPRVLGWDAAGVVEAVGDDCTLFKPGDAVYYAGSIARAGSNSEFQLVDERIVGRKPLNLDFAEAAALPLTAITAWEGLFDRLAVSRDRERNAGKTILIIGAAGGVGSIATQIAKDAGLTVIGTASRPESAQWARDHGADHIIDHRQPFAAQLQALGFAHVDYIFCLNLTEQHWANMAEAIAPQGKICSIVETAELLDLTLLKNKSVTFAWELMFTRALYQTPDMIEQHRLLNQVADKLESGELRTTLTERMAPINAANLRKAHAKVESGSTIGKIVLERFE